MRLRRFCGRAREMLSDNASSSPMPVPEKCRAARPREGIPGRRRRARPPHPGNQAGHRRRVRLLPRPDLRETSDCLRDNRAAPEQAGPCTHGPAAAARFQDTPRALAPADGGAAAVSGAATHVHLPSTAQLPVTPRGQLPVTAARPVTPRKRERLQPMQHRTLHATPRQRRRGFEG